MPAPATVPFPQPKPMPLIPAAIPAFETPAGGEQYADLFRWAAGNVTARVIWVTPAWAQQVLDHLNTRNRKLKPAQVTKVAEDITDGMWSFNGEALIFATTGVLLNGQHRLRAVVAAGVPVPVLAVFNAPADSFDTLDQSKARNRVDVLTIPQDGQEPIKNAGDVAAALNWVHRWELNRMDDVCCSLPNCDVLDLLNRHPQLRASVAATVTRCTRGTHSRSLMAALHYLFGLSDAKLRDTFFDQLLDGTGVQPGSHMFLLSRWLRNRAGQKAASHYIEVAAVVVKTWNRVKANEPVGSNLVWRPDETFPPIS